MKKEVIVPRPEELPKTRMKKFKSNKVRLKNDYITRPEVRI